MNILILTGKFGMGHWSAAQSLRQKILEEGEHRVQVVDFLAHALPGASEAVYRSFSLLVTYGSGIYNTYYKLTENLVGEPRPILERRFLEKLEELVEEYRPDAIISTHPFCARLVSRYRWESGATFPIVTCITDLTAHSEWLDQGTDLYLVGAPALIPSLLGKGIPGNRLVATGIPVRREFGRVPHPAPGTSHRLLVMGGGLGLLPRRERFYEELNAIPEVETTILTGNNHRLRQRLEGRYEHIEVLGYTDRVFDYMAQSDLLLSKPGGITLFEAISAELPILAWEPVLQQEINNGRFMTKMGLGAVAAMGVEDCVSVVEELLRGGGTLEWMADNMRALKASLCSTPITELIAALPVEKGVASRAG